MSEMIVMGFYFKWLFRYFYFAVSHYWLNYNPPSKHKTSLTDVFIPPQTWKLSSISELKCKNTFETISSYQGNPPPHLGSF